MGRGTVPPSTSLAPACGGAADAERPPKARNAQAKAW